MVVTTAGVSRLLRDCFWRRRQGRRWAGLKLGLAQFGQAPTFFSVLLFFLLFPILIYRNQNIMIWNSNSLQILLLDFSLCLKCDL